MTGVVVVVMGVAGSGKTTVGRALASRLGAAFVDADDLHDPDAIRDMAAGRPLDEDRRGPWLDRVRDRTAGLSDHGDVVCACSALTDASRGRLAEQAAPVVFAWLQVPPEVTAARLRHRRGHPVGPSLLPSQYATLEVPVGPDVLPLDAELPPHDLALAVARWLGRGEVDPQ